MEDDTKTEPYVSTFKWTPGGRRNHRGGHSRKMQLKNMNKKNS